MTVVQNSGRQSDNSIGLIAISKHQGLFRHNPTINFEPGAGGAAVLPLLGVGATRLQRTPLIEQLTGHTAIISRVNGQIHFARGFVPNGIIGSLRAVIFGNNVNGQWQNDIGMIRDPTCISYEIPVTWEQADGFEQWFTINCIRLDRYQLRRSDGFDSFNCVIAAVTFLIDYLLRLDEGDYHGYVEQLVNIAGPGQGPLIRSIMGGF